LMGAWGLGTNPGFEGVTAPADEGSGTTSNSVPGHNAPPPN
jgi:hypothetical protein